MSRKDYELIAGTIRQVIAVQQPQPALTALAFSLSEALKQDNAAFDPARFLKACGV